MNNTEQYYFYEMIFTLRSEEHIILYNNIMMNGVEEDEKVVAFLKEEYKKESANYPYQAPAFDEEVAIWAAKVIYITAQLLLYRENRPAELHALFPIPKQTNSAAAILSADLCLRFLPEMIRELKFINAEDDLIKITEDILVEWPFSALSTDLEFKQDKLESIVSNDCVKQLFADRIIKYKNKKIGAYSGIKEYIIANLGMYEKVIWPELNLN